MRGGEGVETVVKLIRIRSVELNEKKTKGEEGARNGKTSVGGFHG